MNIAIELLFDEGVRIVVAPKEKSILLYGANTTNELRVLLDGVYAEDWNIIGKTVAPQTDGLIIIKAPIKY
jgi:hypothetical protein